MRALSPLNSSLKAVLLAFSLLMVVLGSVMPSAWGMEYPSFEEEGGIRENKALYALTEVLKFNALPTSLDLSRSKLSLPQLLSIAETLDYTRTLTELNLANNPLPPREAGEFAEKLKGFLSLNTTLTSLNLAHIGLDTLGAIDVMKGGKNLTFLNLSGNKIGGNERETSLLAPCFGENRSLQTLDLSHNFINNRDAVSIAHGISGKTNPFGLWKNFTLTSLNLRGNPIGAKGCEALEGLKETNQELVFLILPIEEDSGALGEKIADSLRNNRTGACLELWDDEFSPLQLTTIAEALSGNTTLTDLNLTENSLTSEQAREFAEKLGDSLKSNTHLTTLSVTGMSIEAPGAIAIMEGGQKLSSLNLSYNNIGDDSLIAKTLEKHPSLDLLNLSSNPLGKKTAIEIAEALKINKQLQFLYLMDNKIEKEGEAALNKVMKEATTRNYLRPYTPKEV